MASSEGVWIDTAVAASLTTLTTCKIVWQVCLGESLGTWTWQDYNDVDEQSIESAYTSHRRPVTLEHHGATWTVDFNLMIQIHDKSRTSRKIRRIVVVT